MAGYFVFQTGEYFTVGYIQRGERFTDAERFTLADAERFISTLEPF